MHQNVQSLNSFLAIQGKPLDVVERFTYLGSCTMFCGRVVVEVGERISKIQMFFANLCYLWRPPSLSLTLKGCMHKLQPELCFCMVSRLCLFDMRIWNIFNCSITYGCAQTAILSKVNRSAMRSKDECSITQWIFWLRNIYCKTNCIGPAHANHSSFKKSPFLHAYSRMA